MNRPATTFTVLVPGAVPKTKGTARLLAAIAPSQTIRQTAIKAGMSIVATMYHARQLADCGVIRIVN